MATIALAATMLVPASVCSYTVSGSTMTVTLNGDCVTDVTIVVADGWTLDGAGHTVTAIDPVGGHFVGGVIENAGTVAHVRNLHVTAYGLADVCDGGADRLRGILFDGATGSIVGNAVTGINQGASGCQEGNGIEVRNAPFDGTHPGTKEILIADNLVTGYQKNGITANGDVRATVTGNTVVGAGPVPYIAQNGVQFGFGAMGDIRGNAIEGNHYAGCSNQQAAQTGCTPWVAVGLLLFDVDANAVQHSMNHFRGNQRNVVVLTSASLGSP